MNVCLVSSFPPTESGIATYSSYLCRFGPYDKFDWKYSKSKLKTMFLPLVRIFKIWKLLRSYDVVHIQYHLGEYMFLLLPILLILPGKAKIVLTLHEDQKNLFWGIRVYHYFFYLCADLLIVHTQVHKNYLPKFLHKRTVVIPHGIVKHIKLDIGRKPRIGKMVVPGFINPWKGQDLVIRAFVNLRKNKTRLFIIGKAFDKGYGDFIKQKAKPCKKIILRDEFMPEHKLLHNLRSADFVILPHTRTTMSGILCHCIGLHVPLLVSDLPEFREVLGDSAVYFRAGDWQDLLVKMKFLLVHPDVKRNLSYGLKVLAERYYWKNVARETVKAYELLLSNGSKNIIIRKPECEVEVL